MTDRKKYLLSQELQMTFTQDSDCCDSGEGQFLKIKTENGGGGDFYIIETERWAFDNIPELVQTLMRFYNKHKKIESKEL
jgi:serine protease inhibitor ecotin